MFVIISIVCVDFRQEVASKGNRDDFDELAQRDPFVTRKDVRNYHRRAIDFAKFGHTNDA